MILGSNKQRWHDEYPHKIFLSSAEIPLIKGRILKKTSTNEYGR